MLIYIEGGCITLPPYMSHTGVSGQHANTNFFIQLIHSGEFCENASPKTFYGLLENSTTTLIFALVAIVSVHLWAIWTLHHFWFGVQEIVVHTMTSAHTLL